MEGVRAERTDGEGWRAVVERGGVAVLVDPDAGILTRMSPVVVVDAIMAKSNTGTRRADGRVVIGLGPGFSAGADVDAVIETERGHELGRVIREGSARRDSGVPGEIGGHGAERVLRAPADGVARTLKQIGDLVTKGDPVMLVGEIAVVAPFDGCLRGLIHDGLAVRRGMKIGDVDPRGDTRYAATVSDKARAIGGAALEAALTLCRERGLLRLL